MRLVGSRLDRDEPRAADRQRPGLVEHHSAGSSERLQWPAAFDQYAAPRGLRRARDESRRRGEDQRTGRRRDEHREAANRVLRERPGGAGDQQRGGQEQQGIAIRHPHEGGLGALRRRHQSDDAGVSALPRQRRGLHLEGFAGIDRSAQHGFAGVAKDRQWLARHRRFIERGLCADDLAIDRDDLAGADQQNVADADRLDRNVLDRVRDASMSGAGRAIDQRSQVALGAPDREILQHSAAGIHDGDDHAGQRLAERQGRRHGQKGDGVDAGASGAKVANDRDSEARRDRGRARRPDPAREAGRSDQSDDEARHQRCEGE